MIKKIVVIGATSRIAEICLRLWVEQDVPEVILVGRNQGKLDAIASDLRVRSSTVLVKSFQIDFLDTAKIKHLAEIINKESPVDVVLIAQGVLADQKMCQLDLEQCKNSVEINAISPILFAEAFASNMEINGKGSIAVLGSVAGERGRKANYVYGAAKGFIERYVEGLQHRFANTKVKIILIKAGPTRTPMTSHLENKGVKLASAFSVAKSILNGISRGDEVIYAPKKWALIMLVIRNLPKFIFNKMNV